MHKVHTNVCTRVQQDQNNIHPSQSIIAMSVPMSVGQAAQIKEEIPNFLAGN